MLSNWILSTCGPSIFPVHQSDVHSVNTEHTTKVSYPARTDRQISIHKAQGSSDFAESVKVVFGITEVCLASTHQVSLDLRNLPSRLWNQPQTCRRCLLGRRFSFYQNQRRLGRDMRHKKHTPSAADLSRIEEQSGNLVPNGQFSERENYLN